MLSPLLCCVHTVLAVHDVGVMQAIIDRAAGCMVPRRRVIGYLSRMNIHAHPSMLRLARFGAGPIFDTLSLVLLAGGGKG
ncbi:MAG TPA: hypothetical protein DCY18_01265 [Thauera sp.]|nr:hypothetical protein [Thauera sp.]HAY08560.1 hypothetical protein [Thauera sp.]